jgi:homoserine O-succinyltransferase
MFNHIEYDTGSLGDEYFRDLAANKPIALPHDYFPEDNPHRQPQNRWRSHAHLLFGNWINELYQTTPFDISAIGTATAGESRAAAGTVLRSVGGGKAVRRQTARP